MLDFNLLIYKACTEVVEKHIFISYNWDHKEVVHKVKDQLKVNVKFG